MVFSGEILGVRVTCVISAHMARGTVKEGGFFSKIQLGHEIANAKGASIQSSKMFTYIGYLPAFGLSSDGTMIQRVNYESHHITLAVPRCK